MRNEKEITKEQFLSFASDPDLRPAVITIGEAPICVYYLDDGREVLRHYFPFNQRGAHRYTQISLAGQEKPDQGPLFGHAGGG